MQPWILTKYVRASFTAFCLYAAITFCDLFHCLCFNVKVQGLGFLGRELNAIYDDEFVPFFVCCMLVQNSYLLRGRNFSNRDHRQNITEDDFFDK